LDGRNEGRGAGSVGGPDRLSAAGTHGARHQGIGDLAQGVEQGGDDGDGRDDEGGGDEGGATCEGDDDGEEDGRESHALHDSSAAGRREQGKAAEGRQGVDAKQKALGQHWD